MDIKPIERYTKGNIKFTDYFQLPFMKLKLQELIYVKFDVVYFIVKPIDNITENKVN